MQTKRRYISGKGKIMWKSEEFYDRDHDDDSMSVDEATIKGYEDLGNAIILDAMRCYAKAYHECDEAGLKREEKFFHSGFFAALCSIDPDHIMALAIKQF